MECKCSMGIKVLGDGCEVCNPAQALEYAKETIDDQRQEIARLKNAIANVIAFNRQHALDQYGDADKCETWACVRVLREALREA